MPNVTAALIKEAFIDPIRFALLVDDQFPVYSTKIAETTPPPALDSPRAAELFNFCRGRGWLCDVDNASKGNAELERMEHLNQSDLLVLDFHLDRVNAQDTTLSLQILQRLARSDHFNLVIIYTAADPIEVVRDVGFSLGARQNITNHKEAAEFLENCAPATIEATRMALNLDVVDSYLSGKFPDANAKNMRKILIDYDREKTGLFNDVIGIMCEKLMSDRVTSFIADKSISKLKVQGSFGIASEVSWVTSGNVFAVVVSKDEQPAVLVDKLMAGLIAWDPSVLQVMLAHARAVLEKTGRLTDQLVLDTPSRQAGWFLRILLGANHAARQNHIRELYERLFTQLIKTVSPRVVDFALRLIEPVEGNNLPMRAKQLASGATDTSDMIVYHAVNEHLCSEYFTDEVITTGVVFRNKSVPPKYWLCASPACDLVPGQNTKGWDRELHPLRQITTARLKPICNSVAVGNLLTTATRGRHIFLTIDGKALALEVVTDDSREMALEIMFLISEGKIVDDKFSGHIISCDQQQLPRLDLVDFEVVALLRPDYANRLLASVGHQRSRIGVDFVDQPEPSNDSSPTPP